MNCADNNHVTGLWNTLLDASWYRVDSRLVTIDGLGMLLIFLSSLCFQLSGWWPSLRIDSRLDDDFLCFSVSSFCCSSCCLPCHLMVDTCTHGHPHISSHRPLKTSSHPAIHIHVSPILTCCIVENPSAEIRRRLQDAEVELVKLRQSAPKSLPEPLVLRSGERWLVLEMPPEVDLSSRPRVPEFMDTWV